MSTNPDPTEPPPPTPTPPHVASNSAVPASQSLATKLSQLQEAINEMQQMLTEITDELAKSKKPPKP